MLRDSAFFLTFFGNVSALNARRPIEIRVCFTSYVCASFRAYQTFELDQLKQSSSRMDLFSVVDARIDVYFDPTELGSANPLQIILDGGFVRSFFLVVRFPLRLARYCATTYDADFNARHNASGFQELRSPTRDFIIYFLALTSWLLQMRNVSQDRSRRSDFLAAATCVVTIQVLIATQSNQSLVILFLWARDQGSGHKSA